MIRFAPEDDPVALALGLVNSWDTLDHEPEHLADAHAARALLAFYGRPELAAQVSEDDVAPLRILRRRLRRAFGAADEEDAVDVLNAVVRDSAAAPQLVRVGSRWEFRYGDPGAPVVYAVAALTATPLLDVIRTDGWDRFGVCAAAPCSCVYVDRSRNRSRRFCCELCADRTHQAAHRRRRAAVG